VLKDASTATDRRRKKTERKGKGISMKRGGESRSRTGTAERTRQNGERTAGCSRVVKDTFLQVAGVGPALEFLEF